MHALPMGDEEAKGAQLGVELIQTVADSSSKSSSLVVPGEVPEGLSDVKLNVLSYSSSGKGRKRPVKYQAYSK